MRDNDVSIFQLHSELRVRQRFNNGAFHFYMIFFRHYMIVILNLNELMLKRWLTLRPVSRSALMMPDAQRCVKYYGQLTFNEGGTTLRF